MRFLLFGLLWILMVACTTAPTGIVPVKNDETAIDYVGLQRALGMDIPIYKLGYREKTFDTCQAGYGYSGTKNCHREFMVVINIRLQCRDTEGTVSEGVTNADLTPIASRSVKWKLRGAQGATQTDSEGFAQIRAVSARSQKTERLKLAVDNEFLYMRANEITRVVTPRPWCNP